MLITSRITSKNAPPTGFSGWGQDSIFPVTISIQEPSTDWIDDDCQEEEEDSDEEDSTESDNKDFFFYG